jgi:hypothetical protein
MGNFHPVAYALAVSGMIFAERGKPLMAGWWLALASLAKVFPAILIFYLALRRRWAAVACAAGWSAVLVAASLFFMGPRPMIEFITEKVPHLATLGPDPWSAPELYAPVNSGIGGLLLKLSAAGLPFMQKIAPVVAGLCTSLLLGAVVVASRRGNRANDDSSRARCDEAALWLALLSLASFLAGFLPDAYAGIGTLWLVTLLAARSKATNTPWFVALGLLVGVVLPSRMAMPSLPTTVRLGFSLVAQVALLLVAIGVVARSIRDRVTPQRDRT